MIETSILGALLGLLGRLAPEVINFFKGKDDNAHELEMLKVQAETERLKLAQITTEGELKIEDKYVDYSIAEVQSIAEATKADAVMSSNNYK